MGCIRSHGFAAVALLIAGLGAATAKDTAPIAGLLDDVVFHDYPPLARNSEILGRVFTPLTMAGIEREFAHTDKNLSETSFDLASENSLSMCRH